MGKTLEQHVSSIPLNIMEHVIADLLFIFRLQNLTIKNKELFVTRENPKLGLTNLVEHQIHLKPDAVSKHQRPYKLPPHKRDVLRHQISKIYTKPRH
jgi:hypothetical protein